MAPDTLLLAVELALTLVGRSVAAEPRDLEGGRGSTSGRNHRARQEPRYRHLGVPVTKLQIRPLGGGPGCLLMIVISIVASVILTVVLNVILR